jgi:hypothetical protein
MPKRNIESQRENNKKKVKNYMNLDFGPIIRKFIEVFMISSAFYMSPYIYIYIYIYICFMMELKTKHYKNPTILDNDNEIYIS